MNSISEICKRLQFLASLSTDAIAMAAVSYGRWDEALQHSHPTKACRTHTSNLRALEKQTSLHGIQSFLQPNIRYSLWLLTLVGSLGFLLFLKLYYFLFPIPPCHPTRWGDQKQDWLSCSYTVQHEPSPAVCSHALWCATHWRDLVHSCGHHPY